MVLGPLLPSSTSPIICEKRRHSLHTHTLTTPSPTSCCSQAMPGCLLARGGMLVRRALRARRAGTSPGRLMGKERRKSQKSLLAKTQKLGTSWPKAHWRAGGSSPRTPRPPSRTRVPRAQLRPRGSSATLRAQDDASSPPEAALGFFVYIRARWQTALARLSQAGH